MSDSITDWLPNYAPKWPYNAASTVGGSLEASRLLC
jgi:hypothetical protein